MERIPFQAVLEYLESRGWVLKRIWKPYRIFVRGDEELPIMVTVEQNAVSAEDFDKIKEFAG